MSRPSPTPPTHSHQRRRPGPRGRLGLHSRLYGGNKTVSLATEGQGEDWQLHLKQRPSVSLGEGSHRPRKAQVCRDMARGQIQQRDLDKPLNLESPFLKCLG